MNQCSVQGLQAVKCQVGTGDWSKPTRVACLGSWLAGERKWEGVYGLVNNHGEFEYDNGRLAGKA
jgi:hypothetical protein